MRSTSNIFRVAVLGVGLLSGTARAEPIDFSVSAQPADTALLEFSKQSKAEVLFSSNELHRTRSTEIVGWFEPAEALKRLLTNTGYVARNSGGGKFVIIPATPPTGSLKGQLLRPDGFAASGLRVALPAARLNATTDGQGEFIFTSVRPGTYRLVVTGPEYHTLELTRARVEPDRVVTLLPQTIQLADDPSRLAPFVVESRVDRARFSNRDEMNPPPRDATGNLDLLRTQNDVLPYTIYDRDQISRSGVVSLNEFLQRELLDTTAGARAPEQNGSEDSFRTGSANLNLRGYDAEETIVLVNGRRLPEVLTGNSKTPPPDVNFIPLSLVQQVEVLPASASALYTGNPVGGVINIVLRPGVDANATEVTATYTNALRSFDAPQSSLSLIHGESLLRGALRVRLNASLTQSTPPTESELRFQSRRPLTGLVPWSAVFRATPTIRSADIQPLFGPGTAAFTSVAPGADGTGGLAAFAGRAGVRNLALFDPPGDLAISHDSLDYPYGRRQQRSAWFASVVYDVLPRLQIGLDATFARTVARRGSDVLAADLFLDAASPSNPFKHDVLVSLNETAPLLGQDYSEARIDFSSLVLGFLLKLPAEWRLSLDGQSGHSLTKYRGLVGADPGRWQNLVDTGRYNPLRDTQVFGPPREFYDQVLVYRGARNRFATMGDYRTLDLAARATNESLPLPTGRGIFNFGGDYRRTHLEKFIDEKRFSDGAFAEDPAVYDGRTLRRYSVFGELQAPLLPSRWLPAFLRKADTDVAIRYVASDSAREANVSPTYGLKFDFIHGLSLRGSFTTSNKFPVPQLSRLVLAPPATGGIGVDPKPVTDPVRGESYGVFASDEINPSLLSESAVTQTAGLILKRGTKTHRLRASLDFVDTRKVNELVYLGENALVNLESLFPTRVTRAPLAPGDTHRAGRIVSLLTGTVNGAQRRSLNWNTSLDYAWAECFGGTLDLYGRLIYFQRYRRQLAPNSDLVDQLRRPDGTAPGLLKYRANFGASWSRRDYGLGLDGHYFHSRVLTVPEWPGQGHDRIRPHWQFDPYLHTDLNRWLPWNESRVGLRAQLRVNNVLGAPFPKSVFDPSGAGVQPYGDWRGRTYSLSLTATF